ncbi:MAG: hypothetical protein EA385_15755 [Salinarimonadaceae bacterium]|nr:MAG: hypothetical protein EA385_15755 [Salinarimonadaceae bacterium]
MEGMMAKPSQELINERLCDAVAESGCPVCWARVAETNTADDGIPDELAFELVFTCGSRVGVLADGDDYEVKIGCREAGLRELRQMHEEVMDALEEEFPEACDGR